MNKPTTKTKKLTKCEDCKKPLPVHLAECGLTDHICSCTASYKVVNGKFVRVGNERNPVAEFDKMHTDEKKKGVKEQKPLEQLTPPVKHVLQFFAYQHLPPNLQEVSQQFARLATVVARGPQNPETTVALRKLLEAKDCAVRALLVKE